MSVLVVLVVVVSGPSVEVGPAGPGVSQSTSGHLLSPSKDAFLEA